MLLAPVPADAQGPRSHTRLEPRGTSVSKDQAVDLTLTVTPVTTRPIQVWVRTAAAVSPASAQLLEARVPAAEASFVKVGQRVRAFPVESRSSMYQARVTKVTPAGGGATVQITLNGPGRDGVRHYVAEIVTDRGDFLSVPNEAIIEEGETRIVYVQRQEGQYEPQPITAGLQGELYTQVTGGVRDGDQVVTFGSFFIDSEYKLKGTAQSQ
jgi:Cu(I)/Ag(I) efflux system membrane fusion protein